MDADTRTQFDLIREIAAALDGAGIAWWLFGGWGMDFHAGRITRDHDDIEIFSWKHDASAVRLALTAAEFTHVPGLYPDECQTFLKCGQEIGFWFLVRNEGGAIHTPGRWADWPWAAGAFDSDPLTLAGVTARAMSIEGLLDIKTRFASHPHGGPLREKDVADIELLRALAVERRPRTDRA
jgi:hypothetical protein